MSNITIGITTYNRQDLLRETVLSVLNQTYGDFKVIIANDFVEETVSFKNLGLQEDNRVKIINNKVNLGEIQNSKLLLELCDTEWFCYLADDDLFHPNFLESLFSYLHNISIEVAAIYPNRVIGKKVDNEFYFNRLPNKDFHFFNSDDFLTDYLCNKIPLIGVYGLIKTSILKKIGGMPILSKSQNIYSDTVLPILLSEHGYIGWTSNKLVFNRAHDESRSMSSDILNLREAQSNYFQIILNRLKKSNLKKNYRDKSIYHTLLNFAGTQIFIISKNYNLNYIKGTVLFYKHQIKSSYTNLNKKYWFIYTIKLKILILKGFIRKIRGYIIFNTPL